MESEQLYSRGYCRTGYSSYNSITSASSDEELLDGAGATMDFHTTEDDNLLDGDAASSPATFTLRVRVPALMTSPANGTKTQLQTGRLRAPETLSAIPLARAT
ncbi:hypothetical protein NHX12_013664 [Muraenolepis orangiensis]|uniref:Uncharacterized protein n=1 Tax=Muraenolepis orangiensis TaxID=630683 RepID=A0A9Q0DBY2_9TELE|nr:hypothetical protein NHX12_013664 [Muraenolepis orangiensis]